MDIVPSRCDFQRATSPALIPTKVCWLEKQGCLGCRFSLSKLPPETELSSSLQGDQSYFVNAAASNRDIGVPGHRHVAYNASARRNGPGLKFLCFGMRRTAASVKIEALPHRKRVTWITAKALAAKVRLWLNSPLRRNESNR